MGPTITELDAPRVFRYAHAGWQDNGEAKPCRAGLWCQHDYPTEVELHPAVDVIVMNPQPVGLMDAQVWVVDDTGRSLTVDLHLLHYVRPSLPHAVDANEDAVAQWFQPTT